MNTQMIDSARNYLPAAFFFVLSLMILVVIMRGREVNAMMQKILQIVDFGYHEILGSTSEASLRKALGKIDVALFHSACQKAVEQGFLSMTSVQVKNSTQVLYYIEDKGKEYLAEQRAKRNQSIKKIKLGESLGM